MKEVPPVVTAANGDCVAVLLSNGVTLSIICSHTVSSPTDAHIHSGAIGVDGDIICDLGTGSSPITAQCTLTADNIADLKAGNLYVNVHSAGNSGGEIRGQID